MDNHFFAALRARMPEGGRRFIETPDGTVLTYDDLLAGTARYARVLQTLGAVPRDRIAIQIEKGAPFPADVAGQQRDRAAETMRALMNLAIRQSVR